MEYYELDKATMTLSAFPVLLTPKPVITVPDVPWYDDVWQWITLSAPPTDYVPPASFPLYMETKSGLGIWTYKGTDGFNYSYSVSGIYSQQSMQAEVILPAFAYS
jgi:hypothetical protein